MKVVVVGAGVVGLACAFELRRGGADVVVLERATVGAGASLGNTGWVCPSLSYPLPGPGTGGEGLRAVLRRTGPLAVRPSLDPGYLRWLWRFRAHCTRERWREGVRALAVLNEQSLELLDDYGAAGVAFEAHGAGLLVVARTEKKLAAYRDLFAELGSLEAASFRELDPTETREAEPSLSPGLAGALLTEVDRWVRPESLTAGLAAWLRAKGVEVREGVAVRSVVGSRVETSDGPIGCDRVVVAAGIASAPFLAALGVRVTLAPGRGYSVLYTGDAAPAPGHALYLADALLGLSSYDGGLRMAGVFELGHRALEVDERRLRAMLESADPFFATWRPSEKSSRIPLGGAATPHLGRPAVDRPHTPRPARLRRDGPRHARRHARACDGGAARPARARGTEPRRTRSVPARPLAVVNVPRTP